MKTNYTYKMKIKIKDKEFYLDKNYSIIEFNQFLQEQGIDFENNILNIKPTISNFKKCYKFVRDKKEFIDYYNHLLFLKQQKDKNIFENYSFLRDFQKESIIKMLNTNKNGFLLSLEQGLGKTLTSLTYSKIKNYSKIFIIAPKSLLNQWEQELNHWFNEKDVCIYSGTIDKRKKLYNQNYKYNIISYESFRNDFEKFPNLKLKVKNSLFIFDESTKLKNSKSKLYKTFKKVCNLSSFNLFMTGTPINNALQDIDNQIKLIDNKLTNINDHLIKEEIKIGYGINARIFQQVIGYKNLDRYIKDINKVYFRKTKNEVAKELPEKIITTYNIKQPKFILNLKDEIINSLSLFQGFTLLQTLDSDFNSFKNSDSENVEFLLDGLKLPKYENPKLEILKEIIEPLNESVLIFSRFKKTGEIICNYLESQFKDKKIVIVNSGTKNKDEISTKFKNKEIDIVIATDTWSKGISFPDVNYLINFDINPSYETYFQRQDRIHRLNSKEPKFIYNIVGNVIEDYVLELLEEKIKLAKQVTEGQGDIINNNIMEQIKKHLGFKS